MIAAIYARKSTEQHVAEDQKSVARQIDGGRACALRKGWRVDESCIFVDDGISGAEFDKRPGFQRLMAALKPTPPFQVLIMSESSRLGREAWETGYALKQLLQAGVRVWFYFEDRECTFEHPLDKLQFSIVQAFDEMERQRARQRAIDKATSLARAGHVTGNSLFGYHNVPVMGEGGHPSHVRKQINDTDPPVILRIFALKADGWGQKRIAKQLTAEGAVTKRGAKGWSASSVRDVLFQRAYRGELVWNRRRKRDAFGTRRASKRDASEWVCTPAPELRIVSDELWNAAHAQIDKARALYQTATKGLRGGRPRVTSSKYLLPGLAKCALCHGGLHVRTDNHGSAGRRTRRFHYACTTHQNKGTSACRNRIKMPMPDIDAAVLCAIRDEVLAPDIIEEVVAELRTLMEPRGLSEQRRQLRAELADIERQRGRLVDAIAQGREAAVAVLVARLETVEQRVRELADALAALEASVQKPAAPWSVTERDARQRLTEWRELLGRHPDQARALLELLLDGTPLRFTPIDEPTRCGFRFEGDLVIGGLLEGAVTHTNGRWRPHRDSNPGFSLERAAS
jgi:site-specific DNA recombinase